MSRYYKIAMVCWLIVMGLGLSGCGGKAGLELRRTQYVHVGIDPALLDPNACAAWPQSSEHIIMGVDTEASDYTLAGYEAYRCEAMTRQKIREQDERQRLDTAARNR